MRILFTGGGSGGHFYPIIAVARELKKIAEEEKIVDLKLFYIGPIFIGEEDLKKEGIIYYPLATGKIRRYVSFYNITDLFKTFFGILRAFWKLFVILPDVIFSKGGFGAFPVLFTARLYRIPVIIHESDAVPGIVNKWSAKFAKRIAVAFGVSVKFFSPEKTVVSGNPIRKKLLGANAAEAKMNISVFSGDPIIFFNGGSQGSENLNNAVIGILPQLIKKYEVIHQAGKKNYKAVAEETSVLLERMGKEKYHLFDFLSEDRIREIYAVSNLIVSRAGSSSIFEIAAMQKPSILIPLSNSAQNHQRENSYEYAKTGSCTVIEEDNLSPHLLLNDIEKIFEHPDIQKKMMESAQKFSRIDASEIIAREIIKLGLHYKHET
ncbi:MAG: hypothetical protein A3G49_02035 [Candidatus Sungbacteria bacterium RIFCSPLOWO2_12_FULL_41_11]|uniref:UDP-N-acetylglucosamine--N-acetylmuramyl-(pentapeptide) pyrophosphoryl-undecaprenol N-acetylglucosamine transferase n=1 Tax=Candidatus Sungbacteria bacterium RIFCSPLOWO2_12_FULL_41_11 TaxID=1802286 RepID=A0A1G2LS60_9BACT|nr:MAG: hypothetical protein UV01_C0007G0021 [Parcubacteria group bacterium GW2011_GWA2_42_14]OHA14383.1 MAG: hypothetical protein A3G49_02035 [Candidatus Sungbacteria bacterium RIFCSPLOWO2_12_FULL_41_11]